MVKKTKKSKRRGRGEGFIRQLKNGRYEGRYTLHRKNGIACTVHLTRDTREQVLDVFAKLRELGTLENDVKAVKVNKYVDEITIIRNNVNNRNYGISKDITINEYTTYYLEVHRKKGVKGKKIEDTTFNTYMDRSNLITKHIGDIKVRDLTYEDLDRCINEIHNDTCDTTARQTRDILTSIMHFAYKDGIIDIDILQNDRLTLKESKRKKEKKIIQYEDLQTFIDYCKENNYIDLLLLLCTGIRASELAGITWNNIDWKNSTVTIEKEYMRVKEFDGTKVLGTKNVFKDLKTKNSYRTLGLGTEMLDMLKQHKVRQQELAKSNNIEFKDTDWVFTTKNYTGFLNDYLADKMKVVMNKLKIKDYKELTPHCLRHTFCTLGIVNGTSVEEMKEILGHSNIAVTSNWYTHLAKQDIIDASKKTTGYIDKMMK